MTRSADPAPPLQFQKPVKGKLVTCSLEEFVTWAHEAHRGVMHLSDGRSWIIGILVRAFDVLVAELESLRARLTQTEQDKHGAYSERNHLVAALARLFPSGIRRTNIEGWDPEWNGCVYVDLPTGQISYHYRDDESALFSDLPPYVGEYDGHDKAVVHDRLHRLTADVLDRHRIELQAELTQTAQARDLAEHDRDAAYTNSVELAKYLKAEILKREAAEAIVQAQARHLEELKRQILDLGDVAERVKMYGAADAFRERLATLQSYVIRGWLARSPAPTPSTSSTLEP